MNSSSRTKKIVITAVFSAIIGITTAFLLHIPTGINEGYIHLGDSFIYLAASLLPKPYGVFAAAIGGGLGDFLSGAIIWMVPTIIIKSIIATIFTSNKTKMLCRRNIVGMIIACFITIGGYYLAEGILFGNFISPLAGVLGNFVQAVGSSIVYILLAAVIDKNNLKSKLFKI